MVSETTKILRKFKRDSKRFEPKTPIGETFIPNHSGDHSAGKVNKTPTNSLDIVNKKYVDDNDTDTTIMTSFTGGNHKIFYSNGTGNVTELSHSDSGKVLTSQGATTAPHWATIPLPAAEGWADILHNGATSGGTHPQITTGDNLEFRDAAVYISSLTDGHMDLEADISIDFNIGTTEQIILKNGVLEPTLDNDVTLGSDGKSWGEVWMQHAVTAPVRALSTGGASNVYRNTTGHPIIINGTVKCLADDSANHKAYVECYTDGNATPTTIVGEAGIFQKAFLILSNSVLESLHQFWFVVQDDDYYKVQIVKTGVNSTVVLRYWNEADF